MTRSFTMRGPVTREKGVCHYTSFNIGPLFSDKGDYLGANHAKTLRSQTGGDPYDLWDESWYQMQLATKTCPPNTDKQYVTTSRVPVGLFRDLLNTWNIWTSSETNLAAAIDLPKTTDALTSFRKVLKTHQGRVIRVDEVTLREWPGKPATFLMRVTNPENPDNGWYISVDLRDRRWKIVDVADWVV